MIGNGETELCPEVQIDPAELVKELSVKCHAALLGIHIKVHDDNLFILFTRKKVPMGKQKPFV